LAAFLGVRPPTITKTIIRLEEQGFVMRSPGGHDRRQVVVQLTQDGRAVIRDMKKATKRIEKLALSNMKKKERKALKAALKQMQRDLAAAR
jgi:DNA-binding MarR family transcriptional regulator